MRGIFGLIALVLALAVVGVLAVKQLRSNPAVPEALPRAGEASAPAAMPAASLVDGLRGRRRFCWFRCFLSFPTL